MEEPIIPEVSKIEKKDQVAKKSKKILVIVALVVVFLVSSAVAAYIYWKKVASSQKVVQNQPNSNSVAATENNEPAKLILGESIFKDRSLQNPININLDENSDDSLRPVENLKLYYISATKGTNFKQASDCNGIAAQKMENFDINKSLNPGFCVGGYAAFTSNQSVCETYDFKAKYKLYSMCDGCGMKRNFIDGNSAFESCHIGFGISKKNEKDCLSLPDAVERKNVPDYEDNKTSPQEIKKESCIYGAAIGKNNYDLCEYSGFFKDSCYYNFAIYRRSGDLCDKISNPEIKSRCILALSRLTNILDKCMEVQQSQGGPVAYSNMQDESEKTNKETEDRDMCIYNVVNKQKLSDKSICEKIVSPYYKFLCREDVAVNLKDSSLCNFNFLGSQINVDACLFELARDLKDTSLCQKASDYDRCVKLSKGEPVPTLLVP